MVDEILGNFVASKAKHTRLPFHHMESLLYSEILARQKLGNGVSNTFIHIRSICLLKKLQEDDVPWSKVVAF